MKLTRCPCCHSNIHLDALIQDDAGRELLATIATVPDFVARPLLNYLGLFRPAKSDLSNTRAVRLLNEVVDVYIADHVLASALVECVNKLREKRLQFNDSKPLANHNYLKSVYQTVAVKNNVSPDRRKNNKEPETPVQQDNSAWYIEQAEKMIKLGQDPLGARSTIAKKLNEMNWSPKQ